MNVPKGLHLKSGKCYVRFMRNMVLAALTAATLLWSPVAAIAGTDMVLSLGSPGRSVVLTPLKVYPNAQSKAYDQGSYTTDTNGQIYWTNMSVGLYSWTAQWPPETTTQGFLVPTNHVSGVGDWVRVEANETAIPQNIVRPQDYPYSSTASDARYALQGSGGLSFLPQPAAPYLTQYATLPPTSLATTGALAAAVAGVSTNALVNGQTNATLSRLINAGDFTVESAPSSGVYVVLSATNGLLTLTDNSGAPADLSVDGVMANQFNGSLIGTATFADIAKGLDDLTTASVNGYADASAATHSMAVSNAVAGLVSNNVVYTVGMSNTLAGLVASNTAGVVSINGHAGVVNQTAAELVGILGFTPPATNPVTTAWAANPPTAAVITGAFYGPLYGTATNASGVSPAVTNAWQLAAAAAITSLNANNLTSGKVPLAAIPSAVVTNNQKNALAIGMLQAYTVDPTNLNSSSIELMANIAAINDGTVTSNMMNTTFYAQIMGSVAIPRLPQPVVDWAQVPTNTLSSMVTQGGTFHGSVDLGTGTLAVANSYSTNGYFWNGSTWVNATNLSGGGGNSGGGVTSGASPFVTVSSKGIANGLSTNINDGLKFGPDTPGTSTCGLQEAINTASTSNFVVQVAIQAGLGDFYFTNVLWFSNYNKQASIRMDGMSGYSTKFIYAGNLVGTNCITLAGSDSVFWPFNVELNNIRFTAVANTNNVLLRIVNETTTHINGCHFTGHKDVGPDEWGLPDISVAPALVGLVGGTGGDDIFVMQSPFFCWLATGLDCSSDHKQFYSAKFDSIGVKVVGDVLSAQPTWPSTSVYSLGAAVVDHLGLNTTFFGGHIYQCALCLATFGRQVISDDPEMGCSMLEHTDLEANIKMFATDVPGSVGLSLVYPETATYFWTPGSAENPDQWLISGPGLDTDNSTYTLTAASTVGITIASFRNIGPSIFTGVVGTTPNQLCITNGIIMKVQ
jgi:hypothetical protein